MDDNAVHNTQTNVHTAPLSWDGKAIGLLDLDAFFASVEQLDHPTWRGKPVVVGGDPDKRGVVATASYEARTYGIHSAMPSAQARRLCPDAIFCKGNFARYHELSDQVMQILCDETPFVEKVSIDEAFFDITPGRFSKESPIEICMRIQKHVAELGITCSIGLGTNKTIAKIASEQKKPRGLTCVPPGAEAVFLAPLPIKAMSGIGQATAQKLELLGIHTLGQLARIDDDLLVRALGVKSLNLKVRAAGKELSQVKDATKPDDVKSISNEKTFSHDLVEKNDVLNALDNICSKVARRLRKSGFKASCVTVKVRFDYATGKVAQIQLPSPTCETQDVVHAARLLLGRIWKEGQPVRLLGVGVTHLDEPEQLTMNLFDDEEPTYNHQLTETYDLIKEKFGDEVLAFGKELRLQEKSGNNLSRHQKP